MVNLKCRFCGKEFDVPSYRKETAMYCSRSCKSLEVYQQMKSKGYGLAAIDGHHLIGNTHRKGMKPTNAFSKGHVPWNKNIKGLHLSIKTEFVKGFIPTNKMSVGTITQRRDKYGTCRNYIKVAEPSSWKAYAVFLWEETYGKVKKDYVIHHINKDPLDDRLDNFEMLSRSEHLKCHMEDYKLIRSS